jgi:hypothetical protein
LNIYLSNGNAGANYNSNISPGTSYTSGNPSTSYTSGNPSSSYTSGNPSTSYASGNPSTSYASGNPSTSYGSINDSFTPSVNEDILMQALQYYRDKEKEETDPSSPPYR